jgi:hypothetical protein
MILCKKINTRFLFFAVFHYFEKKRLSPLCGLYVAFLFCMPQPYFWAMFVRMKLNKCGLVRIQVIEKIAGNSTLVKTVGSSSDPTEIAALFTKGKQLVPVLKRRTAFILIKTMKISS